jgi:hypothetical protein
MKGALADRPFQNRDTNPRTSLDLRTLSDLKSPSGEHLPKKMVEKMGMAAYRV